MNGKFDGTNILKTKINELIPVLFSSVKPFKGQVWAELRHNYNSYNLFEDPEFPATDKSMFFSQRIPIGAEWRRPKVPNIHIYTKVITYLSLSRYGI
jgi:hypothetical protein